MTNNNNLVTENKTEVNAIEKLIFSKNEMVNMQNELVNNIDKALLLALFEGIKGEDFSELINMKAEDLKEFGGKFYATLQGSKGSRIITISQELYNLLLLADKQSEYINTNGNISELPYSSFIFKNKYNSKPLDGFYVTRKIILFREMFGIRYLKARDFASSGLVYMASQLLEGKNVFEEEDFNKIAQQYNMESSVVKSVLKSHLTQ